MSDKISEIIRSISELSNDDFEAAEKTYKNQVSYHHSMVPKTSEAVNRDGRLGLHALVAIKELQSYIKNQ